MLEIKNVSVKYGDFTALDNISFNAMPKNFTMIVGPNGAGKSTILKMITGVAFPTKGEIYVKGKVGALLELSAGFDSESTGRENIYLKCSLMGMGDEEIKEKEKSIVDFADLGDYIDQPLRSYSSGMKARLGFAINTNTNPDILIVDEALSVGDKEFRKRCKDKITEIMADKSVTLLFVTHSLTMAEDFCERGIVLEKGKKIFDGAINDAIEFYDKDN